MPPNSLSTELRNWRQFVGADVGRIGVKLAHHAADRGLEKLAAIDFLHIVAIDLIDCVGKELVKLVVVVLGGRRLFLRRFPTFGGFCTSGGPDRGEAAPLAIKPIAEKTYETSWVFD